MDITEKSACGVSFKILIFMPKAFDNTWGKIPKIFVMLIKEILAHPKEEGKRSIYSGDIYTDINHSLCERLKLNLLKNHLPMPW